MARLSERGKGMVEEAVAKTSNLKFEISTEHAHTSLT